MADENALTGYQPDSGSAAGRGGRMRSATIMSQVDDAAGAPKHPAATPSTPATSGEKQHPAAVKSSSFVPTPPSSTSNHVYGSPIEEPVAKGGSVSQDYPSTGEK